MVTVQLELQLEWVPLMIQWVLLPVLTTVAGHEIVAWRQRLAASRRKREGVSNRLRGKKSTRAGRRSQGRSKKA